MVVINNTKLSHEYWIIYLVYYFFNDFRRLVTCTEQLIYILTLITLVCQKRILKCPHHEDMFNVNRGEWTPLTAVNTTIQIQFQDPTSG